MLTLLAVKVGNSPVKLLLPQVLQLSVSLCSYVTRYKIKASPGGALFPPWLRPAQKSA